MSLGVVLAFAATEFVLSLTPGPAVLLVVSQGVRHGFGPSVRGTSGILTGNAFYFGLSALGLGAVLVASGELFTVIKWAGAGYLIYQGARMLLGTLRGSRAEPESPADPRLSRRLYTQGLVTQLSNPKALVFFTALLPQFVSPDSEAFRQFLLLGVVSISVECPILLAYGWSADRGRRLLPSRVLSAWRDRIAGSALIGTGAALALRKDA